MTPLPGPLAPGASLVAWRLDAEVFRPTWDSGVGAERGGGRWNPKGLKVVYCSVDPSTTILESAVHRGFDVLDAQPFVLTCMRIHDPVSVKIVLPTDVPNPAWLHGGIPSAGQQSWGAHLLESHAFVAFPSVVSKLSWNVVFRPDRAAGKYTVLDQERLVLDTRLKMVVVANERPNARRKVTFGESMELVHCVYCSASTNGEFNSAGLTTLLAECREKNSKVGLTGMLLYHNDTFFQVLEGDRPVVEALLEKLVKDKRHERVTKIILEAIEERAFARWTMGYSKISKEELADIPDLNDFFAQGRSYMELGEGRAKTLLNAFKEGAWRLSVS